MVFNDLKDDFFTWGVNLKVLSEKSVDIKTNEKSYKFIVQNTSNEGVIVSRLDAKGKVYVVNRNDKLIYLFPHEGSRSK